MSDRQNTKPERISAEEMVFDANLAEFANRVQVICSLEALGHLSPKDAFARIKTVWKELRRSKQNLRIEVDEQAIN